MANCLGQICSSQLLNLPVAVFQCLRVFMRLLNPLLTLLFAVAFIYFIYTIITVIRAGAEEKTEARAAMMWAIVGMFIMISVYGIINLLIATFQINPPPAGSQSSTTFIQNQLQGTTN